MRAIIFVIKFVRVWNFSDILGLNVIAGVQGYNTNLHVDASSANEKNTGLREPGERELSENGRGEHETQEV